MTSQRSQGRKVTKAFVAVATGIVPSATGTQGTDAAPAHSQVSCVGVDRPVVGFNNAPGRANQSFKVNTTLPEAIRDEARAAANAWGWFTDVNFTETTANQPAWQQYFTVGN